MLNASIITACLPSIKRFLADLQSGLMGVNISEPYELTHTGGRYVQDYGKEMSFSSRVATRLGISTFTSGGKSQNSSSGRSRNEKIGDLESVLRSDPTNQRVSRNHHIRGGQNATDTSKETDSVKGLTVTDDVIVHTIDYKVEYEDGNTDVSVGGRSSRSGQTHSDRPAHGTVTSDLDIGRGY
jgi:hypothetical protein